MSSEAAGEAGRSVDVNLLSLQGGRPGAGSAGGPIQTRQLVLAVAPNEILEK